MDWFERAENELIDSYNRGEITEKEFKREMADLRAELRAGAEEAAEQAYNDHMGIGGW